MKNKLIIVISVMLMVAGTAGFFSITKTGENDFEKNREKVLSQLYLAIDNAEKLGKYKCCIEPPCTMCYLGDWIWEDGTCDCDKKMAMGEWDKVCPQCIKGVEEGRCKSTIGTCTIP